MGSGGGVGKRLLSKGPPGNAAGAAPVISLFPADFSLHAPFPLEPPMPRRNSGKRLRETENGAEQNGDAKIRFRRRKCRRKRWACWGVEKRGIRWKMGVKMGKESRFNLSANESFKQNREKFPFKTGAHS